jgi:hypothetical protein
MIKTAPPFYEKPFCAFVTTPSLTVLPEAIRLGLRLQVFAKQCQTTSGRGALATAGIVIVAQHDDNVRLAFMLQSRKARHVLRRYPEQLGQQSFC